MPYDDYDPDDPDAPLPEDVGDAQADDDSSDADGVFACPSCGRWLHEDAAVCPACGEWIIAETTAARRSRGWFWPIMVAVLVAVILIFWHGMRGV